MDAARYFEEMHLAMSSQKPEYRLVLSVKIQDLGGADAYLELRQEPVSGKARVFYSTMGRQKLNFQLVRKGWQSCHNASGELTGRFPATADGLLAQTDFSAFVRDDALDSGIQAVQAHRTAKNRDTDTAVLDAASEEVNNSIFRRGHVALGFSSALIGSGMAFDYKWFRENIACCTTSGEDKELEALLLRQGIYIDYLDDVRVLDEKVQGEGAYYNQRRRWIAAQFYALSSAVRQLPGAILSGNTDYCDKLLQWCLPPRILLLGLVPLWAVVMTVCAPMGSIKWWVAVLLLLLAMAMALPDEQADARLGHALRRMPVLFLLTLANLFRLRGTKDKFIHTEHTGAGSEAPGNNTGNRP